MSISIAARKAKGRKLQQHVRDIFREVFKDKLEPEDIESRQMGGQGTDVILTPSAKRLIPFDIECKSQEKLNLTDALGQMIDNTAKDRIGLLVFKRNHDRTYCALELSDFIKLLYGTYTEPVTLQEEKI